jgi:hypothetical protein
MTNQINGDMVVRGHLSANSMTIPVNTVTSDAVQSGANINADKLESRIYASHAQANSAATAETRTLFVARRTGIVNHIYVGSIAKAIGDSTVTVDVRKNGTTILSSAVTLNNANTARIAVAATIDGTQDDLVAGDWLEAVITISAGTGTLPTGVFVQVEIDQNGV